MLTAVVLCAELIVAGLVNTSMVVKNGLGFRILVNLESGELSTLRSLLCFSDTNKLFLYCVFCLCVTF